MILGVHHTKSTDGLRGAVRSAADLGCGAVQFHQKPVQAYWFAKDWRRQTSEVADLARSKKVRVFVHAGCINLASPDARARLLAASSLIQELDYAEMLGAEAVVLHPGSLAGGNRWDAIRWLAEGLSFALRSDAFPKLVLETMPGSGDQLGSSLSDFHEVFQLMEPTARGRTGICLDTCHMHAAGYELLADRTGYARFWDDWDAALIGRIGLFHLNGARHPRGSRRDGHVSLDGLHSEDGTTLSSPQIDPNFFGRLLRDERFASVPKVLETPPSRWAEDLSLARRLGTDTGGGETG